MAGPSDAQAQGSVFFYEIDMKRIMILFILFTTSALADNFDCEKKAGEVFCKAKKDAVVVDSVELNGGECPSDISSKIKHKVLSKGEKFLILGSKECSYVAGVKVKSYDGHIDKFVM